MIRVTVMLDSAVHSTRSKKQATIEIFNMGGNQTKGKYGYRIFSKSDRVLHEGEITDFPRQRGLAIDLLGLVLVDARGEKWLKY